MPWGEKRQGVAAGIRAAGLAFCPWFSFSPDVPLFALASLTFFVEKVRRRGVGFPVCWDSPGPGEVPALYLMGCSWFLLNRLKTHGLPFELPPGVAR